MEHLQTRLLDRILVCHPDTIVGLANQTTPRLVQSMDVLLGKGSLAASSLLSVRVVSQALRTSTAINPSGTTPSQLLENRKEVRVAFDAARPGLPRSSPR